MKIASGSVVQLEYRLHLGDGQVVDQSEPGSPLSYLQGGGQIVPGLEQALEGLVEGDTCQVVVKPEDGYGVHDARGLQEVPRAAFPAGRRLEQGMNFDAETEGGHRVPVRVYEVKQDVIIVDLNHPLAGKTLHFDVAVRGVRQANPEELSHGHAHGPGKEH